MNAPGRKREIEIHESWKTYLQHFDRTKKEKSQNAFIRWVRKTGSYPRLTPSHFSLSLEFPISEKMSVLILDWANQVETKTTQDDLQGNIF